MTEAEKLAALSEAATQEMLSDEGHYFADTFCDLASCSHGETGHFNHRGDGPFIAALWNAYRAKQVVLIGPDAVEALRSDLHMACELIQEAKGMADGPDGGSVTDHLDAAENWIDKVSAALAALGVK